MYGYCHHYFNSHLFVGLILSCLTFSCVSSKDGVKNMRPSPPAADTSMVRTAMVTINYSSPAVKKRKLLGGLIPIGKIWRTGANEATIFSSDKDLLVMGQVLPRGKYAFFTKATKDQWEIIFNTEWDQWGAYNYNKNKDALRVEILPYKVDQFEERMLIQFKEEQLMFHWGNLQYTLELEEAN